VPPQVQPRRRTNSSARRRRTIAFFISKTNSKSKHGHLFRNAITLTLVAAIPRPICERDRN
jgi:hypothetical protein